MTNSIGQFSKTKYFLQMLHFMAFPFNEPVCQRKKNYDNSPKVIHSNKFCIYMPFSYHEILNKGRNKLLPSNAEKLLFVHENISKVNYQWW